MNTSAALVVLNYMYCRTNTVRLERIEVQQKVQFKSLNDSNDFRTPHELEH